MGNGELEFILKLLEHEKKERLAIEIKSNESLQKYEAEIRVQGIYDFFRYCFNSYRGINHKIAKAEMKKRGLKKI